MSHPDLSKEMAPYARLRPDLLQIAEGKFAVIQGEKLLGVYDTRPQADAVAAGLAPVPALVVKIVRFEKVRRVYLPKC